MRALRLAQREWKRRKVRSVEEKCQRLEKVIDDEIARVDKIEIALKQKRLEL